MPIYEYSCAKCHKTVEVIQKMSDKPLKTHQGCGGKLTKLISASGFQFKGTGWYVTDYARKGKSDSAESSAESPKESKPDASKPADSTGGPKETGTEKTKTEKPAKTASSEKAKKS